MLKMGWSPIFEKKFEPIFGQKMPKNRVFWTFCKICSLVFPDFLCKGVELKCANYEKNFGANFGPKMLKNRVFLDFVKNLFLSFC